MSRPRSSRAAGNWASRGFGADPVQLMSVRLAIRSPLSSTISDDVAAATRAFRRTSMQGRRASCFST